MEKKNSGLGIASMVLGILAILGCFIPYLNIGSFILGFISVIFAIIALCKKSKVAMPIVGLVLSIIAFGIGVMVNGATTLVLKETGKELERTSKELDKITGDSTDDVLNEDVSVELGSFNVTDKGYGIKDTEMVVTIKNISNKKHSYSIHVEAVDASGNRIDDDYIYVNDLAPEQTTTKKIFVFVTSDQIEAMRNATFKIVEASAY